LVVWKLVQESVIAQRGLVWGGGMWRENASLQGLQLLRSECLLCPAQ